MTERVVSPENWWPTPIVNVFIQDHARLDAGLARIIYEKEQEILKHSNPTPVAGQAEGLTANWLEYNVLKWDYPEIAELREHILFGIRAFIQHANGDPADPAYQIKGLSIWANVVRFRDALEVHHHDPAFCSIHYHVTSGHEDDTAQSAPLGRRDSGNTVYFRPGFIERSHGGKKAGAVSPWDDEWRHSVPATPGKLLVFPSYIRHEVRPHFGNRDRISIAGDCYIAKQESLIYFGGKRWYVPK
jgi:putative 2-oxoglutarate-Fe(II)-dependent oxygenase superfamily protein